MISYTPIVPLVSSALLMTDVKEEEDIPAHSRPPSSAHESPGSSVADLHLPRSTHSSPLYPLTSGKESQKISKRRRKQRATEKAVSRLTDGVETFSLEWTDGRLFGRSFSGGSDLVGDAVRDTNEGRRWEGAEFAERDHPGPRGND
jgi:hypothetical protein